MIKCQPCGCKGIRTCLLCEASKPPSPTKATTLLQYCLHCYTTHCPHLSQLGPVLSGVIVIEEFISEETEKELVKEIDCGEWAQSQSGRLKQDYGPRANYKKQKMKMGGFKGLPRYSKDVLEMLGGLEGMSDFIPVEQCNLDYNSERGSGVDPHFDDFWLWGERLVILNLLSDSCLTFSKDKYEVRIPMKRLSLLIIKGVARHKWKHCIAREDISKRRISVTFRELSERFLSGERKEDGQIIVEVASNFI